MKKILIVISLFFAIFLLSSNLNTRVFALTDNVKEEGINPESGFSYKIKRLEEKVMLFLKFNPNDKISYYKTLLDRRLSELAYVVDKKDGGFIETTSQRYASLVGEMKTYSLNNKLDSQKDGVEDELSRHINVLENLRTTYDQTTAQYRFVMNDLNSANDYLGSIKK